MRDHRKLKVFELADSLVPKIYQDTRSFPRSEIYGLVSQMRRAAVSVAANIFEGCGRQSAKDYDRFLYISFASLRELGYYIELSARLEYLNRDSANELLDLQGQTAAALAALIRSRKSL